MAAANNDAGAGHSAQNEPVRARRRFGQAFSEGWATGEKSMPHLIQTVGGANTSSAPRMNVEARRVTRGPTSCDTRTRPKQRISTTGRRI